MPAETASYYIRLRTRPLDQAPFAAARPRIGEAVLRRQVLAGATAWSMQSGPGRQRRAVVHLAASGAVLPEVLTAAAELADEGIAAHVIDVTSLDRLHADVAAARSEHGIPHRGRPRPIAGALPGPRSPAARRSSPLHDAAARTRWPGSARRSASRAYRSGWTQFGQSGSVR